MQEQIQNKSQEETNTIQQKLSTQSNHKGTVQSKQGKRPAIQAKQQPIQAKQKTIPSKHQPVQRQAKHSSVTQLQGPGNEKPDNINKPNNTGLPDDLKAGVENLSGYSMDDVKVHYNSEKPAQLQAHAYAQGTDIHVGPGQEQHLPHEAWHVIQQKQGRVKPTMQMKKQGVNINDDASLEKEADVMGTKALQAETTSITQQKASHKKSPANNTIQPMIAVNQAGDPQNDYAIIKQIQQLRKYSKDKIVALNGTTNFSTMKAGETLYIASHGQSENGQLQGMSTEDLINLLGIGPKKIPAHIAGIRLLSCYGGEVKEEDGTSLAAKLKEALGVKVEGAVGFSFGTTNLAETGYSSVLSSDKQVFYKADNINDMVEAWLELHPTKNGGVLTQHVGYVDAHRTVQQNMQHGGLSLDQAQGWAKTHITRFKSIVKLIESQLKSILTQIPGDSVKEKIKSMENATAHSDPKTARLARRWDKFIDKQTKLFDDYYLWTGDGAFQEVE